MKKNNYNYLWGFIFLAVLIWSGIEPKDQFTWFLEVSPALIGAAILFYTRKTFPLTPLLYILILMHCIVLMVGGHYTYAEVPLFDHIKELMGSERNNYDKVGHFFQGFVPALIAREILIRKQVVKNPAWLNLFIISICLAFSAFYELIEWWVALLSDQAAESFLGTQGYVWDTQSDMLYALIGAIICIVSLSKWHDKQLTQLPS
jgi:putative membrane protein